MAHDLERITRTRPITDRCYWYAVCDCFWKGPYRPTPQAALDTHTAHVAHRANAATA